MAKRLFDIVFSLLALPILIPFLILISIAVFIGSGSPVFYFQNRVGRNNREFGLIKFRTMVAGSDKKGLITVGKRDNRITQVGHFLRKYKLDELPQFINVLLGDMSVVGPRPEVKKYVSLYTEEQLKVLSVRPGLTDPASLEFVNESEILTKYTDPEKAYIEEIMPKKLEMNLDYIENRSLMGDIKIILKTLGKIIS
ncbi:MAG: sugar transferase [Bacteroidales bacterium]